MPSSNKARAAATAPRIHPKPHHHTPPTSSSSSSSSSSSASHGSAHIDIRIAHHYAAKVYTTGSAIAGSALICPPRDVRFDRVTLQLAGFAAARNYMAPELGQVLHRFLLLDMPVADRSTTTLPPDGILRAGRTYALPFRFVVPRRLPLGACAEQRCEHPTVREHHLRLPPSMGAAAGAVWGDRDDGSPETARVRYCVCVSVLQRSAYAPQELVPVLRAHHEVSVLPSYAEDAPLDIQPGDTYSEYKLAASKTLRRTLVSRKLGVVAVEAAQPAAVVLSSDARRALSPTRIVLKLRFLPAARDAGSMSTSSDPDEASLPAVHAVAAKLVAKTYYNTSHMGAFPDRGRKSEVNYGASLYYSDTTRIGNVRFSWADGWRAEGESGAWTATLDAGLELPMDHRKILLPTFHSCLLSRTYTLRLVLTVGPGRTHLSLSLPLQITVEGGLSGVSQETVDVGEPGEADAALPRYKDHLFVQHYHEVDTYIPIGIGIIM